MLKRYRMSVTVTTRAPGDCADGCKDRAPDSGANFHRLLKLCSGEEPTLIGTGGNDRLRGTKRRDVIDARAGDDRITDVNRNDKVCGARGDDVIQAGRGFLSLFGVRAPTALLPPRLVLRPVTTSFRVPILRRFSAAASATMCSLEASTTSFCWVGAAPTFCGVSGGRIGWTAGGGRMHATRVKSFIPVSPPGSYSMISAKRISPANTLLPGGNAAQRLSDCAPLAED